MSATPAEVVFREAGGRVVAALAARFRDLDLAEEATAEALASAVAAWAKAPPRDPAAWLYAAALRKALDLRRRSAVRARAAHDPPPPEPTPEELLMAADQPLPDERLRLIFVCCHPGIAPEARAALTLKVVGGLTTERIARAFLTSEPTLAQRLVRAKRKIRDAGVPFEVPTRAAWGERLEAVLATLEIAYAQAYEDAALANEAADFGLDVVRLSGLLAELLPEEPEVLALAALVRLAESRRRARLDEHGAMVPLTEQDPVLWDEALIAEGERLLHRAARLNRPGPYQLMAALHGAHASRRRSGVTPWPAIVQLYDLLRAYRPLAVTEVNRAVALAAAESPEAGLAALEEAARGRALDGWLPFQVARAALLERTGRMEEAAAAYATALALGPPPAERVYLGRRAAALTPSEPSRARRPGSRPG